LGFLASLTLNPEPLLSEALQERRRESIEYGRQQIINRKIYHEDTKE